MKEVDNLKIFEQAKATSTAEEKKTKEFVNALKRVEEEVGSSNMVIDTTGKPQEEMKNPEKFEDEDEYE